MLRTSTSHPTRPQDDLYWILLAHADEEGNGRKDEDDDDEPEDIPPGSDG